MILLPKHIHINIKFMYILIYINHFKMVIVSTAVFFPSIHSIDFCRHSHFIQSIVVTVMTLLPCIILSVCIYMLYQ